jgi:hypothetical protein
VAEPGRALHIHDDAAIHRGTWLLGLLGAVVASGYVLNDQGVTPARLAHAVIVIAVAAAVPLAARKLSAARAPSLTFHGQGRYVALARDSATITDTKTWTTTSIPGARKVHDLNESGIVATTATQVLVADHRGKTRLSLPAKSSKDTYDLRQDGRQLVIIRRSEGAVETFTVATGERVSSVVPENLATGELRRHRK